MIFGLAFKGFTSKLKHPGFNAKARGSSIGTFRSIAETHQLPLGAELEALTGFEPDNKVSFDAWSPRIRMPRPNGGTYAFMIRERIIRSRLIGPEERKVIQKWGHSPMGSFQRMEYQKDREAAAWLDRSKRK